MLYSVGCEYAMQALSRLAARVKPGEYCLLRDLLDGAALPGHFVGKIFQTLVREDILVSAKGRGGGFALCRSPEKTTPAIITTQNKIEKNHIPPIIEPCPLFIISIMSFTSLLT